MLECSFLTKVLPSAQKIIPKHGVQGSCMGFLVSHLFFFFFVAQAKRHGQRRHVRQQIVLCVVSCSMCESHSACVTTKYMMVITVDTHIDYSEGKHILITYMKNKRKQWGYKWWLGGINRKWCEPLKPCWQYKAISRQVFQFKEVIARLR